MSTDAGQGESATAPGCEGSGRSRNAGVFGRMLSTLALSLGVSLAVVGAYHAAFGGGGTHLATVDLQEVFTAMQRKATNDLMSEKLTPDEKERVKQDYLTYGERLQGEIDRLSRECGCLIVAKQVVLTQRSHDYTARVKQHLGL